MKKILVSTLFIAFCCVTMASTEDDLTSLSYISYLERYATILPADQNENIEAVINMPLVDGDRVDTAREARMEVVLSDGNTMWLDEYTTLSLDAVAFGRDSEAERTVVYLAEGSVIFEINEHNLGKKPVRFDGRSATVYLDDIGLYRLYSLPSGGLRVEVLAGLAEAATSAGGVLVRAETAAEVEGGIVRNTDSSLAFEDDFTNWVATRRQVAAGESGYHIDSRYARQGAALDSYGSWVYVDSINSWAWQPAVGPDWRPYTAGRWYWTPTGQAWISYEPWGWLPYHYGSWHHSIGFGWVWSWGGYWGPSWVSWIRWPGYIGWCPYGYYDNWYWGHYSHPYYPYYPHHGPDHPGGGGGAHGVPRRDVMPPRNAATGRVVADGTTSVASSRPALDISGRVRLADMDRNGWTVVSERDFASPHLNRVAQPGERIIPTDGDQTGVVMTGVLATRSPSTASARSEIDRIFRDVESSATTDISPLLARDSSLSQEAAQSMANPSTVGEISRRPAAGPAPNNLTLYPTLSTRGDSPFNTSTERPRTAPNLYRPTRYQTSGGSSGPTTNGASAGSRTLVAPRSTAGRTGLTRPVIIPQTSSSRTESYGGRSGPATRSPTSVRSPTGSRTSPSGASSRPSPSSGSRSSAVSGSRSSGGSSSGVSSRSSGSSGSRSSGGGGASSRSSGGGGASSRPSGGGGSSKGSSGGASKR